MAVVGKVLSQMSLRSLQYMYSARCCCGGGLFNLGVSKNNGIPKSSISSRVFFHYKPSILGYPYFRKHPYVALLDRHPGHVFCMKRSDPKVCQMVFESLFFEGVMFMLGEDSS